MKSPDWIRTVRHIMPRILRVLRGLQPTYEVTSVADLGPDFIQRHHVHGIIWDVDGTLTAYHDKRVADALEPAFVALCETSARHVILSNASEDRMIELAAIFPTIPIVGSFGMRKPSAELIDRAVAALECRREHVVMIGDQYFTDVAGANLGGVRSIKVRTFARPSFPFPLRLFQRFEDLLYRALYRSR